MTSCTKCIFGGLKVHGRGPKDSPLVIVGEAPGAIELYKQQPFVGPSGKVIDEALKVAWDNLNIAPSDRVEPYFCNALECFPRNKDEDKLKTACLNCRPRLFAEIEAYPRSLVIGLGNAALWSITGNLGLKITRVRGTHYRALLQGTSTSGFFPTVHPAYLLRGTGSYKQFREDIQQAISCVINDREIPQSEVPIKTTTMQEEMAEIAAAANQKLELAEKRFLGNTINAPIEIIDSWDKAHKLRQKMFSLRTGTVVGSDIETASFSHRADNKVVGQYNSNGILCFGLYWGETCYIVEQDFYGNYLFPEHLKYVWHNGKFDIKFFWHRGIMDARVDEDTMLMSYGLNERRGIHDLDQVASDRLGTPKHKDMLETHLPKVKSVVIKEDWEEEDDEEELEAGLKIGVKKKATKKKEPTSYAYIPKEILYPYLMYDVVKTWHLHNILRPLVKADKDTEKLYTRLFIPATEYLAEIELEGIDLDREWTIGNLKRLRKEAKPFLSEMDRIAKETMGYGVNPRSPKQLQELLYGRLKLGPIGQSTNVDTLEKLPAHPFVTNLLKYRKIQKLESTYVKPLLKIVGAGDNGRVHTTYKIPGTVTGRLASSDPNVQNVPRLPWIRGQYRAPKGFIYIEPDLNQAELRSLACMSGDEELCRIYNTEGLSLHDEVRATIFGYYTDWSPELYDKYVEQFNAYSDDTEKSKERVLGEQKMIAKNVNFGIVYGITAFGLAEQIEQPVAAAEQYIGAWFKRFPKAKAFINMCMEAARTGKTITTVYGRKKRPNLITYEKVRDLQNEYANFPHQSTASDIVLDTGIRVRKRLKKDFKTVVNNTVHDSILLKTPYDIPLIKEVYYYVTEELSATPKMMGLTRVPFKADAKVGERWGNLTDFSKWIKSVEEQHNITQH